MRDLGAGLLVERCLEREEAAWSEFLRRYADLIYSTIHRKVGLPAEECDDAFQNTILSIHTNLGRLRDPDRIVPWIVQIAYRQGVNWIRSRSRMPEMPIEDLDDIAIHASGEAIVESLPPEEERLQLQRAQRAQELLALLPDRCRQLLWLLFYEDPTPDYVEIARTVGIAIGSIGPTRARCLAKMRQLWEERGLDG